MAVHDFLDTRLAKFIRVVVKWEPRSAYRLTGSFLQSCGWQLNLKRVNNVWDITFTFE